MLRKIFSMAALHTAWLEVNANRGGAGTDQQDLDNFALDLYENLKALQQEIFTETYRPQPLLRVWIPKRTGGFRSLAIPTVRDRVAQKAAALFLTPIFEKEFEDCSYGYRKGRGVDCAVRRVVQLRDEGYRWVVDADIHSFFDEIDHQLLLSEVARLLPDNSLLNLLNIWLKTEVEDRGVSIPVEKGVPQGSPLSPLLSNLYLDQLDEELLAEDLRLIRFADDFLVLCKSGQRAAEALELTEDVLDNLKLRINSSKTKIVNFNRGFRFLGVQFVRTLVMKGEAKEKTKTECLPPPPPPVKDTALSSPLPVAKKSKPPTVIPPDSGTPLLRTLYLLEHGTVLGKQSERFVVRRKGEVIRVIPAVKVDQIFVFGMVQLTTQVMQFCLQKEIPIYLLSGHGHYYGVVDSFSTRRVMLHREQFISSSDDAVCLRLAREFIRGKIGNCRVVLLRYARTRSSSALKNSAAKLKRITGGLDGVATLDQLRGMEGAAAREYFSALGILLGDGWNFSGRKRRPPSDPVNALLSYGYTLLLYNVYSLLLAKGLNPFVGYLHPLRAGHPALASDIIEEFRAPVVDAVVCNLLLNGNILQEDFTITTGEQQRCRIHNAIRQRFITRIEEKLNSSITHPVSGIKIDYRRCIEQQLQELAAVVMRRRDRYRPMILR